MKVQQNPCQTKTCIREHLLKELLIKGARRVYVEARGERRSSEKKFECEQLHLHTLELFDGVCIF